MRFEDFETLIALHGTRPDNWPDPALADDPEVATWLRAEQDMDAALTPDALSPDFADRVMAAVAPDTNVVAFPARRFRPRVAIPIAAALIAGAFVFLNVPASEADQWEAVAENSGWGELYAWVEG